MDRIRDFENVINELVRRGVVYGGTDEGCGFFGDKSEEIGYYSKESVNRTRQKYAE